MPALPNRQREILEFIRESIETEGLPPTYPEIEDRFHVQRSAKSTSELQTQQVI